MNISVSKTTGLIAGFRTLITDNTLRRNLFSQGIGQFIGRLLFYLFFLYTARMLGVDAFGTFSLALSIGYLVYSAMEFGLDTVCVKSVAREGDEHLPSIVSARIITTLSGLLVILSISLLIDGKEISLPLIIVGGAFALFSLFNFFCAYFRGIEEMQYEAKLLIFQRSGVLVLAIFMFFISKTAVSASLAFFFSTFVAVVVGFIVFKKNGGAVVFQKRSTVNKDTLINILKMAFPLALAGSVWSIYYRIDNIMIGCFKTIAEVGVYSGAYKIAEGIILFPRVIMIVVFPQMSRLGIENNNMQFHTFFNALFWVLVVCAVLICGVIYLISEPLFIMVLGAQYTGSVAVFKILLLSVLLMFPGYLVTQALITLDLQHLFMYIIITSAVINILLNYFMIPAFGIKGAAWATVCSDLVMTSACGYFLIRNKFSCPEALNKA